MENKTKTLEEKLALEFMESSSKGKENKEEIVEKWDNYLNFYLKNKSADPILYKVLNKRYNEYLEGGRNGKYKKDNN